MKTIPSPSGNSRINVSLPKTLLSELEKYVPSGRKSGFVADAVEKELAALKRKKALEEFAHLPPTFTDIDDSVAYVRSLRAESEKRLKRVGV
jgi:hypothetical protein